MSIRTSLIGALVAALLCGPAHTDGISNSSVAASSLSPIASLSKASPHLLFRATNGVFGNAGGNNQTFSTLSNLEAPPALVRLIFYNDQTGATWPVGAAYISPTTTFGVHADDGYNPYNSSSAQDNTMGVQVTFNNGGAANFNFFNQMSGSTATASITAAPVAVGQPTAYYSDWVKVNGLARIDGGPGALLLVRVFGNAGAPFRYQNGATPYESSGTPPAPFAGRAYTGDWLSGNQAIFSGNAWTSPNLFAFGAPGIEYIPAGSGISILGIGDSITSGNQSTGGFTSFGAYAAVTLSTPAIPVAYFSEGFSGRTSTDFLANGYNDIVNLKPQVVTIQAWSQNDTPSLANSLAAYQSAIQLAKIAIDNGVTPILTTAAPADCSNGTIDAQRAANNALVRSSGLLVLDLDKIWGTGATPNCYQPQYNSGDNTHPNNAGYQAAGAALTTLISSNVIK